MSSSKQTHTNRCGACGLAARRYRAGFQFLLMLSRLAWNPRAGRSTPWKVPMRRRYGPPTPVGKPEEDRVHTEKEAVRQKRQMDDPPGRVVRSHRAAVVVQGVCQEGGPP